MSDRSRREFLLSLLAGSGVLLLPGCDLRSGSRTAGGGGTAALDPELLAAVARDLLPSELGEDGVAQVVVRFRDWLSDYEPGVELDHGYLATDIEHAGEDPTPQWAAQLRELDEAGEGSYAEAAETERRRRLRSAVAGTDGRGEGAAAADGGPAREGGAGRSAVPAGAPTLLVSTADALRAPHIVLALLHFYFSSPDAADLCFGARIRPLTCRGLPGVRERPT